MLPKMVSITNSPVGANPFLLKVDPFGKVEEMSPPPLDVYLRIFSKGYVIGDRMGNDRATFRLQICEI